eukprot:6195908-Pleurochrysis_carterae.AAC.1
MATVGLGYMSGLGVQVQDWRSWSGVGSGLGPWSRESAPAGVLGYAQLRDIGDRKMSSLFGCWLRAVLGSEGCPSSFKTIWEISVDDERDLLGRRQMCAPLVEPGVCGEA